MATTNFVNGTVIEPSWLNDVDAAVYETLPAIPVDLANTLDTADGDALIGVKRTESGAVATTQHAVNEQRPLCPMLDFGAVGDGVTNDQTAFENWAAAVNSSGKRWVIPNKLFVLNGSNQIVLKQSGDCYGTILIPKTNSNVRFEFTRDASGSVLSTTGWTALTRGKTACNALNAAGLNLFINSTETLIERDGNAGDVYVKQEFIRCPYKNGTFSTGLVCSYASLSNVTVTAYSPSRPITVNGLRIRRTGTGAAGGTRGSVVITRDNVTLNDCQIINDDQTDALPQGIEVSYCADVTLNRPAVSGCEYAGLGYGVQAATTIGLTINDANLAPCRHSVSGRHNVDWVINRGIYSDSIDDHWGDRMVINDAVIYTKQGSTGVLYAGNDITLNRVKQFGGRTLLGIRSDTPQIGGDVRIISPQVYTRGEVANYTLFSYDNQGVITVGTFSTTPRMPDSVVIEDPTVDCSDATLAVLAYLPYIQSSHLNWGSVEIRGVGVFAGTSPLIGVLLLKHSSYQQTRIASITVQGNLNFGTGSIVYVSASDSTDTRAAVVRVGSGAQGNMRYCPYGVARVDATEARIGDVTIDAANPTGSERYTYTGCEMTGGAVSAGFRRTAFLSCRFTGNYSAFPVQADVTMEGNIKLSGVTGLPTNIRGAVVSPYA